MTCGWLQPCRSAELFGQVIGRRRCLVPWFVPRTWLSTVSFSVQLRLPLGNFTKGHCRLAITLCRRLLWRCCCCAGMSNCAQHCELLLQSEEMLKCRRSAADCVFRPAGWGLGPAPPSRPGSLLAPAVRRPGLLGSSRCSGVDHAAGQRRRARRVVSSRRRFQIEKPGHCNAAAGS